MCMQQRMMGKEMLLRGLAFTLSSTDVMLVIKTDHSAMVRRSDPVGDDEFCQSTSYLGTKLPSKLCGEIPHRLSVSRHYQNSSFRGKAQGAEYIFNYP